MPGPERGGVDTRWLSSYLRALGLPNRLEILRLLKTPRAAGEIQLRPARQDRERRADRPLSRGGVEVHLRKLEELGLVEARVARRGARAVTEYSTNHARLFAVIEELRRLSLLTGTPGWMTETTDSGGNPVESLVALQSGPALVAVGGPLEGRVFPLEDSGPWTVGRSPGAAVSLPYDPFLSKENTRLVREHAQVLAQDLPGSRNGTRINWRRLAEGERATLAPGDVLGVGRSLLVFRGA